MTVAYPGSTPMKAMSARARRRMKTARIGPDDATTTTAQAHTPEDDRSHAQQQVGPCDRIPLTRDHDEGETTQVPRTSP